MIRTRVLVHGQVQGVGFRPFVHRLASAMALGGWVRNDAARVEIEIEGAKKAVEHFLRRLKEEAPPAARIEHVEQSCVGVTDTAAGFAIVPSINTASSSAIAPDTGVCAECVRDMCDPANRRYRYPFTHCVECGPRYTITARLPFDRANTSMARFTECGPCRAEREQAGNRRFHAQTNACSACGPRLWLCDGAGNELAADDVIGAAVAALAGGDILAVKGLGGFHLVCDARNAAAVQMLRARKARLEKPFAVMFANVLSARQLVRIGAADAALLAAPQRPIVLLPKNEACDAVLPGVAPELAKLGVMLPSTPIQYLLFHEAAGRPSGMEWLDQIQPMALVMTSANLQGEALVIDNRQALTQLAGIADLFLMHERDILMRCDDSVQQSASAPQCVRRARGYVPTPLELGVEGAPGLAVGSYLNNTVCVTRGKVAHVSEHIGDLDTRSTRAVFDRTVTRMLDVLQVEPAWIAADLHPDFHSTQFAHAMAAQRHLPLIEVQHHHAHVAAVLAEHRLPGAVLGLALDGFGLGLGSDGTAWGGELLLVDGARCERLGHFRPLPLPGGDRAAREPWRMAAAALYQLGRGQDMVGRFGPSSAMLVTMLEKGLNTPRTSSAGRCFDAAAGLLGIKPVCTYEGQAAALLEGLAAGFGEVAPMAGGYRIEQGTLNLLPLLGRLADLHKAGKNMAHGAALFHATVAAALADWVLRAAAEKQVHDIVFAGGCFANRVLSVALRTRLEAHNLRVFEANLLPPGDGGLSLGQAWVALRQQQT